MLFPNARRRRYSLSDVPNYLKARSLGAKADASIDPVKFQQVIARHETEGYDSYKYFDKRFWLRSKMMRAVELGLDKSGSKSVLDLGCGAGYFLYCCKFLGHRVHGVDIGGYDFYTDMIAFLGLSRTSCRIEAFRKLPPLGSRFDVITAHQICFNGHRTNDLWGADEWDYFLSNLKAHLLNEGGIVALEFNEEPSIGFYTDDLQRFFESKSARIFRGRVIISSDKIRSRHSESQVPQNFRPAARRVSEYATQSSAR